VKILVAGGGGREHALVWALGRTGRHSIIAAPGNPGMIMLAELAPVAADNITGLRDLALNKRVDLVVAGPEAPLVAGLADLLAESGIPCFGPYSGGAKLEGSKWFAKDIMSSAGVPTAEGEIFTEFEPAIRFIGNSPCEFVIKADGLAAGKGVFLPRSMDEAVQTVEALLSGSLGESGKKIVIEQRLEGPEVSVLAMCNGSDAVVLPPSRDHKRIGDGDTGPNTGGMGAICPVPDLKKGFSEDVRSKIILPVLRELTSRGIDFRGVLYAGLIITGDGPKVLEFNVRFGDPETQAVLPMIEDDLAELCFLGATGGTLPPEVAVRDGSAACVILASGGYPGSYAKGFEISGLDDISDVIVFHAGTKKRDGVLITAGGRVLGVTGLGRDLDDALNKAYGAIGRIGFEGMYYRRDIGRTI